jgi:RimJ/RimL family protein N-acetyltransferase
MPKLLCTFFLIIVASFWHTYLGLSPINRFLRPIHFRAPSSYQSLLQLDFKSSAAVADLPVDTSENARITKELGFKIKEANFHDLAAVVSLRINVFYPELKTVASFHSRVLEKMRQRRDLGSICLLATRNPPKSPTQLNTSPRNSFGNHLLAAVEFSSFDFANTTMESIGAARKLYVADLAVREDARRLGIATQLLDAIESYATQNNYEEIYLHVEVDNMIARAMYLKNGYLVVPQYHWAQAFTESRLHKPVDQYVFLWKSMSGRSELTMANPSEDIETSLSVRAERSAETGLALVRTVAVDTDSTRASSSTSTVTSDRRNNDICKDEMSQSKENAVVNSGTGGVSGAGFANVGRSLAVSPLPFINMLKMGGAR